MSCLAPEVRMPFDRFYESLFHLGVKLFPDAVAPTDAFQRVCSFGCSYVCNVFIAYEGICTPPCASCRFGTNLRRIKCMFVHSCVMDLT